MALQKQTVNISFGSTMNTKVDPFQIPIGQFLVLKNIVFDKDKLLEKRNGFGQLSVLPSSTSSFLTTFSGNLTSISDTDLSAYSSGTSQWVSKGSFVPLELSVLPLIRNNTNQAQCDTVVAPNGLACVIYTDQSTNAISGTVSTTYKYAIIDSSTSQIIVSPTTITPTSGTLSNGLRVFLLANYFVIVFSTSTSHLQYIRINSVSPTDTVASATDVTTSYTGNALVNFDGVVANNILYLAWNGNDGGGAIRMTSYNAAFTRSTGASGTAVSTGKVADVMSVCADTTQNTPIIWVSFSLSAGSNGYSLAVSQSLNSILTATQFNNAGTVLNLATAAKSTSNVSTLTIFIEFQSTIGYGTGFPFNFVYSITVTQAGVVGSLTAIMKSVGLASKAFIIDSVIYVLTAYSGAVYNAGFTAITTSGNQQCYFLLNSSGSILSKLAYGNGGGYLNLGLPSVSVNDSVAQIPYLFKDLVTSVNKNTNVPTGTQIAGIYTQTGVNLASFDFTSSNIIDAEIGSNLHLSGGLVWAYDGSILSEQNFHLFPDNILVTTSNAGGSITAQTYYYAVTYEWTDNQGNVHRSAPSIPVSIVTTGATSTNTIKIPTLWLTMKTANPVRIVVYRWSTARQVYYSIFPYTKILLNDTAGVQSYGDGSGGRFITVTDTFADDTILGNAALYTTGGVIENIGPPAATAINLFKSRFLLIDAEDQNLLWYSKQVIEGTPVEMSDLFTIFVAPTTAAEGPTGPMKCLGAMDDKEILFKDNAIYYFTGDGPDNTGASNDFSNPVFITSTVGCSNQNSIVFQPQGLMFESNKGIWLLGRDLSTSYIGAPVEDYTTDATVLSAVNIPNTNQVRFIMSNGKWLVYDYFFGRWSIFEGIPAASSTLFQGLHTFVDSYGRIFQETPGEYLDGARPVLLGFTTGWINVANVQGYERAYEFYLLGKYISPHTLSLGIAYDYNSSIVQSTVITPDNFSADYGESDGPYGSEEFYGGPGNVEQWRIHLQRQKCEAFQLTLSENFDASLGAPASAGLTLSGLNLIIGMKKGYPKLSAKHSTG